MNQPETTTRDIRDSNPGVSRQDDCGDHGDVPDRNVIAAGDRNSVWIVVPAFNEAGRLPAVLAELERHYGNIVVVDDGSTDQTPLLASQHRAWCLSHVANCGQGAALQTGITFALYHGADIIVTFDADGQHRVDEIERLLGPIRQGIADVCLGSRFLGDAVGITWGRWIVLKVGVFITRLLTRLPVTDTHNGLRAFGRRAAQRIQITLNGMAHASELLDLLGSSDLRVCEAPVTIRYSVDSLNKGQSSLNSVGILCELLLTRIMR